MKIEIKGPIIRDAQQWIYDWLEMPATSPKKVNDLLLQAQQGEEIQVIINSGGGDVFAGSEIFTSLKEHGNTRGKIVGLAASAASVAAMGVDFLEISPTAQIMIHQAATGSEGNADEMQKTVDALRGIDKSIANAYLLKTGMAHNKLLDMMAKETWLTAQDAKDLGFADSIMFADEFKAVASVENNGMIPEKIINKIMEEFKNKIELGNKNKPQNSQEIELLKAKLALKCTL